MTFAARGNIFAQNALPILKSFICRPVSTLRPCWGAQKLTRLLTAQVMSDGLLSANALPMLKWFNAGL